MTVIRRHNPADADIPFQVWTRGGVYIAGFATEERRAAYLKYHLDWVVG